MKNVGKEGEVYLPTFRVLPISLISLNVFKSEKSGRCLALVIKYEDKLAVTGRLMAQRKTVATFNQRYR